jgi:CRISPR-associated protein Csm1
VTELGALSEGTPAWGILRGDIDHFEQRLRRATTVEEHILLSVLFKEFFAGELSVLCTMPDFWRKVSILYRGGDDFAVFGAWDALVALARELERVFSRFTEQHLKSFAGLDGKTVSMALSVATGEEPSPVAVFEQAGAQLQAAKAAETGTFHLFGRTLEWKRLADAEDLKSGLVRLVNQFGYPAGYIHDVASVYREAYSTQATKRNKAIRVEKPWRTFMQLSQVIPPSRNKELAAVRSSVITNLVGKSTANLKLRPSSRVGLEWARLATGS